MIYEYVVEPNVAVEHIDGIATLKKIERIARICYQSESKTTENSYAELVVKLLKNEHHSLFEHISITATVICDRAVANEIVRHRVGSYAQESTRYCNYNSDRFSGVQVCPMLTGLTQDQIARRMELYHHASTVYQQEISEGIQPQQARDNLLLCTKTEIAITFNLRQWRHFLKLRCAMNAHPQIRKIALMILTGLYEVVPIIFDDIYQKYRAEDD